MKKFNFLFILLLFSGCVTQKKCNQKFPPIIEINNEKETIIIKKDSLIKGATITNTIKKDSIIFLKEYKVVTVTDKSGLAELSYYKDAYGNLVATCKANDRLIEQVKILRQQFSSTSQKQLVRESFIPFWIWLIIGAFIILILRGKITGIITKIISFLK